jgi:hypothetical protein
MNLINARAENRRAFVKGFNEGMKKESYTDCQQLLDLYCSKYIEEAVPSASKEWGLRPEALPRDFFCILAHSSNAKRILGHVTFSPESSKRVPKKYQYSVQPYVVKIKTLDMGNNKKRRRVPMLVAGTKNAENLITPKRGWWLIWQPSMAQNITISNYHEYMSLLISWYNKYITGMEKEPPETFPRVREHYGFEQFMLKEYPNERWRNFMGTYKKVNQRRPRRFLGDPPLDDGDGAAVGSGEEEEEEGGGGEQNMDEFGLLLDPFSIPPPPPPPPLPMPPSSSPSLPVLPNHPLLIDKTRKEKKGDADGGNKIAEKESGGGGGGVVQVSKQDIGLMQHFIKICSTVSSESEEDSRSSFHLPDDPDEIGFGTTTTDPSSEKIDTSHKLKENTEGDLVFTEDSRSVQHTTTTTTTTAF